MKTSIIIPTYNRTKDLEDCLNSILTQIYLPFQIIVVDNSHEKETQKFLDTKKEIFKQKNILFKYIKNKRGNSLTVARNIGIENALGDIVLFLDDDTVLNKNYIKKILEVYKKYPKALGVQGYIAHGKISKIRNLVYKLFFLYHLEKNGCRALTSVSATYPFLLNKIINCQWLSGANHSYKRFVLKDFKYDEKLKKYSEGEDLEMSYRIFKKYPNSLYINPNAQIIHKTSPSGRLANKKLIYMREVYALYLFYKIFDTSIKNKLIYTWSRIGKLIINVGTLIFRLSFIGIIENFHIIKAYIYCINHIKEIKSGELEFFNKKLK